MLISVFAFLGCCENEVNYSTFGHWLIPLKSGSWMAIAVSDPAIIVLRYQAQDQQWLKAKFENGTSEIFLESKDDVILNMRKISLFVNGPVFPPEIDLWILKEHICPHAVFGLPSHARNFIFRLHADPISESSCIFLSPEYRHDPVSVKFGIIATDEWAHLEIYSEQGMLNQDPRYVCLGPFCEGEISYCSFARLRVSRKILPSVASAFIQIGHGPGKWEDINTPFRNPKLFYNESGNFVVGSEYDIKEIYPIFHPENIGKLKIVRLIVYVAWSLAVILFVVHIVLTIMYRESKGNDGENVEVKTAVLLNPYCKESSAQIIMSGGHRVGNRPLTS
jgi:hypothetical protein